MHRLTGSPRTRSCETSRRNVEDGQQPRFWIRRAAFDFGLEPGARPHHLASVEKCDRQIGFRIEVSVKAGLGTARPGQDSIDADLVDPVRTEQIVGRIEDALARSGRASGSLRSQVRSIATRGTPLGKERGRRRF